MDAERNGPGALSEPDEPDEPDEQDAQAFNPSAVRHKQGNTQALHGDTSWQA